MFLLSAQALNRAECRIIHVVGDESVLSCYDVNGSSMIAFYSDPPSDGFDGMDAEVRERVTILFLPVPSSH